jgi:hypothetical protein
LARLDPDGMQLLQNYQDIYKECHCIVVKNMKIIKNVPPCAFSEAVHAYVMHTKSFYQNKTWRLVSAFFEYTCMEIAAQQALAEKRAAAWVEHAVWPKDHRNLWNAFFGQHASAPQYNGATDHLTQVHEKVHETNKTAQDILAKLEDVLSLLKKQEK